MMARSSRQSEAVRPQEPRPPGSRGEPCRVIIEHIRPLIDGGRFPIKRTVGETITVAADIFADGHEVVVAVLRDRHVQDSGAHPKWRETPMVTLAAGTDEWTATYQVSGIGWHEYSIIAWIDRFRTWRRELQAKASAGQDVSVELLEGSMMVREASARALPANVDGDAEWLLAQADALSESTSLSDRVEIAQGEELLAVMDKHADRSGATRTAPLRAWVDRERAGFGAWYEMFPRSAGPTPARSATFREASVRLSALADLGFDVLYLPPIHPIGRRHRKGRNNALVAGPDDPGSPWAIGSELGGHTAIDPELGTLDDFETFRAEAERLGLEIALDLAFHCSPDHPWVHDHPEWFRHRPDGTIKYAENPPKKYQDIYPFDFGCDEWPSLWEALLGVTRFWIDRGIKLFRVDNPHTKTFGFWEWLIATVHTRNADVVFLSEAFTRPAMMRYLAKAGFTQSYTYFTWRNTKQEIAEYLTELTATDVREYLRPNLFANTPDILHHYLQSGGRPAFEARLLLAATLGANYGIYSGFELCEANAVPGTEEYANSEKYQYRHRNWDAPGNIKELVACVNRLRHRYPALHSDRTLQFHATDNREIIAYSKSGGEDFLLMVVNLDPHHVQQGFVHVPLGAIQTDAGESYQVRDLLDDVDYWWRGEWNYVRFEPGIRQGHILKLAGKVRR
jgi:starch synthase (maltosyl-transferring)